MRDRCEAAIVKHLRSLGRTVILLGSTEDGMPDLLVIWGGGFALLEVKDPDEGVLSKEQRAWHASYRGPRGTLHVVRCNLDAERATGIHGLPECWI